MYQNQVFIHDQLTTWTVRLNTQTHHVHLHHIDPPIIFKVIEKTLSLLLLLRVQQSHGHPVQYCPSVVQAPP